jgi:hypothetical protein
MENTKVGWTDVHTHLTRAKRAYRQGLQAAKIPWVFCFILHYNGTNERYEENPFHVFCIKTCVFIVSDHIWPVVLPPQDSNTYEGEIAFVSGYGLTSEGKFVDPFNSYSTDKELLLYRQWHMDLIEIKQLNVIWNPTVTFLMQSLYEPFAVIAWKRLCYSRYNIQVSQTQEILWGVLVIKFKLARSEVLTAVLLIRQVA